MDLGSTRPPVLLLELRVETIPNPGRRGPLVMTHRRCLIFGVVKLPLSLPPESRRLVLDHLLLNALGQTPTIFVGNLLRLFLDKPLI